MSAVIFFLAAAAVIAGAVAVVVLENPFYSVLGLVSHLVALAALFLLLHAEFVAAAQVVVYAGAVMVLYVFVVAYVGGQPLSVQASGRALRVLAPLCAGALLVELCIAILGSSLQGIDSRGAPSPAGFGQPGQVGELLLTRFLLPFEVASILLLVAAVGAVVLARRHRGLEEERGEIGPRPSGLTATQVAQRPRAGTMAEGVGARPR